MTRAGRLSGLTLLLAIVALPGVLDAQVGRYVDAGIGTAPREQDGAGGSSVPCAVPLGWRVADVEDRFGLATRAVRGALSEAFAMWESAAGRQLFSLDDAGHPISFEFDERQANAQRRRAEREVAEARARDLESSTQALLERQARHRVENDEYRDDVVAQNRRQVELNREVADWNQRTTIPDSVRTRLGREREGLDAARRDLDRRREQIEETGALLAAESDELNRDIDEHNRAQARAASVPTALSQAGRYDEEVTTRDGLVEDVRRRIRVFRFDDPADLVLVLAHELGHALGLGHVDAAAAVMSAVSTPDGRETRSPGLHPGDIDLLGRVCPTF